MSKEAKTSYSYFLYDLRYTDDPDAASCFLADIDTLKEARKEAKEYGGAVVVKHGAIEKSKGEYEIVSSETIEIIT